MKRASVVRDRALCIRLREDELRLIEEAAAESSQLPSAFVRDVLLGVVRLGLRAPSAVRLALPPIVQA